MLRLFSIEGYMIERDLLSVGEFLVVDSMLDSDTVTMTLLSTVDVR